MKCCFPIDPSSVTTVRLWEECWAELVPSSKTGVKVYLRELLELACSALQAQLWRVRALGAAAIASIIENIGKYMHAYIYMYVYVCIIITVAIYS